MARLQSLGVCVREGEFSETSQVVTVFTREHGIVRGLAKGARRNSGSFDGGVELLSRGELLWVAKPAGQLSTLTAWTVLSTSPALRNSWTRWACAMYLAQLIAALFQEADPHPRTFDRVVQLLEHPGQKPLEDLLETLWLALDDAGFRVELDTDIVSGAQLGTDKPIWFLPGRGGFTIQASENAWGVRGGTLNRLRQIEPVRAADADATRRAIRLLHAYAREILGRELSSWDQLSGLVREVGT